METGVSKEPAILLGLVALALLYSAYDPVADRLTWLLETLPVMIGIVLLLPSRHAFPLTLLLYRLLALHALILIIGGHYTYAEVPLFNWLRDTFELSRNHYDRIGHLAQGFIPAILAREILLRRSPLSQGGWLFLLVTSICLAFSAFYEMIEWWTALLNGEAASAFLGTQGDIWDTQWDMFLALTGAITAQLLLGRMHDRALSRLRGV
jgi:putative membrane protein